MRRPTTPRLIESRRQRSLTIPGARFTTIRPQNPPANRTRAYRAARTATLILSSALARDEVSRPASAVTCLNRKVPCLSAAPCHADLLCICCLFVAPGEGRDHPLRKRQQDVANASSTIIGRQTLKAPLSLGLSGGNDEHTSDRDHPHRSVCSRIVDRPRRSRRLGECTLEKFKVEPAGSAAERQEPVRHYRIFVVVKANPFRSLLDDVVLLLVTADRAILQFGALPRVDVAHPCTRARQNLRQNRIDLVPGHAGLDARVVENVEKILVVDVEESHLDVVIEHRPRH